MKNDLLAYRHIGISEKDEEKMLQKIGVKSLDELIDKTIPANIRLKEPLALPKTMTEYEFGQHIAGLAAKNKLYTTYIGMGWYNTITPAVIQRNVFENPVWYTSYTPYQTEVSQGRLEALMNFQTAVCDLTGMPLANCSLLDEATAAAEAVTMMYALRPRDMQKSGANVVFVDEAVFPQTLAVMTTRAIPQGIELRIGKYHEMEFTPDIFACVLQYPNAAGNVEDYRAFVEKAHAANCKVAVAADILSLALLTPPGEWGADIVFGTTQRLGTPMFYGGPSAAYFATRDEYKRNMPGTDAGAYDPAAAGEQVMLQGVVDCFWQEADGIVILDFKTDYIDGDLQLKAARYAPQLQAYARALSLIYGLSVRKCILYFFSAGKAVEIDPE